MFNATKANMKLINARFVAKCNEKFFAPFALEKVINEIEKDAMRIIAMPNDDSLERLEERVLASYIQYQSLYNLKNRELMNLPFILSGQLDEKIKKLIMHTISLNTTNGMLKREINVYFLNYEKNNYITDLRIDIYKKLTNYTGMNSYLNLLKQHMYLFNQNCIRDSVKHCQKEGFLNYLESLRFDSTFKGSKIVQAFLLDIFDRSNDTYTLQQKVDLFVELSAPREREIFKVILPEIITRLILEVDELSTYNQQHFKDALRERILLCMGDPRLSGGLKYQWHRSTSVARKIFLRWISQYDLDLFFNIIDKSIQNDGKAKFMWAYRRAFWSSYKDDIKSVWVCFGPAARQNINIGRSAQLIQSYGNFISGDNDGQKSCIIIEIGHYMFIERSHNGAVKVWDKANCPFDIGENRVYEFQITKKSGLQEWAHSSSITFNWQKKVGSFIKTNCGIGKMLRDWEP